MATTRITRRELLCENLVEAWTVDAERSAQAAFVADCLIVAPYSYAELRAANAEQRLGAWLAGQEPHQLRAQAVRFLVEREAAHGVAWAWGDIDAVEATFARLVDAYAAEQRALALLEIAQAAHGDAIADACTPEEERELREQVLTKADVYFERRAAREALEREAFPAPRISKTEIRQRIADLKRADIAARRAAAPRGGRRATRGW